MSKMTFLSIALVFCFLQLTIAENRWEKLGSKRVSPRGERDIIEVGRKEGFFDAVRVEADNGSIFIRDIRIIFANGEVFSPNVETHLREDSKSRVIDLPGNKRLISRVEFVYRAGGHRRDNVTLHLYGRHGSHSHHNHGHHNHGHDRRWEKLGSKRVSPRGERDIIEVGRREGFFDAVRVEADNGSIFIRDIKIIFANGEVFSPNVETHLREDSKSRVIDLPGNKRLISRVEFVYRAGGHRRDNVTLHLYGRHGLHGHHNHGHHNHGHHNHGHDRRWEKLGSKRVSPRGERDIIEVGRREGFFDAVRVEADNGSIFIRDIKIIFVNGEVFSPNVETHLREDSKSRVIDLPGNKRFIARVEFIYRAGGHRRDNVTLHLYGRNR